jgi:chlorobactene glucosyltransferase
LVPARNEADNVLPLLLSITAQDYKDYEVIVYDDDSTDDTYAICSAFAKNDRRFSVIKGGTLPAGWLGKNYACDQLAKRARGDYFLFLDADEVISNGLINSAIHRMKTNKLGLLSLFSNQVMLTAGEKISVPLLHFLLLNLFPLRLVFLTKNPLFSTACGQFMLFDADGYRENQWHRQVKDQVVEDAAIMKLIKAAGYNGETLLANAMISCRMYKNYAQAISGFAKNALAAFNYSIAGLLTYVLLLIAGPMIVMMTLDFPLIFFMTGLILLTRIMISLSAGENVLYNIVLHPLQMASLTIIACSSIQKYLTNSAVWKGRNV